MSAMLPSPRMVQPERPGIWPMIRLKDLTTISCWPTMRSTTKPSRSWFRFGFPVFYVTDVLQNLESLTSFGYGADPRLAAAMDLVSSKQDGDGRWKMEYTYNGKTWVDIEEKRKPSKWVTLRALRVLRWAQ